MTPWVLGCMNKHIFTSYLLQLSTIAIIKLQNRNAFFWRSNTTTFLTLIYLVSLVTAFYRGSKIKRQNELDLVLLGWMCVECFCTAFWDLKSFLHLYLLSHEPPEHAGRLMLLLLQNVLTTIDFLFHEGLRLCSVSVHLGAVLFFLLHVCRNSLPSSSC